MENIDALLARGRQELDTQSSEKSRRSYYRGDHPIAWAPADVSNEYMALRKQSMTPLIRLAVRQQVQRLKVNGVRSDYFSDIDEAAWTIWRKNYLTTKEKSVYTDALIYEKGGIVGVWVNPDNPDVPSIVPQDPMNVFVARNSVDPFDPAWAFKRFETSVPEVEGTGWRKIKHEYLYTRTALYMFDDDNEFGDLRLTSTVRNPFKRVPFIVFKGEMDASAAGESYIDSLIPLQDAIDTILFDLLLAAQFAAYKQRIVTGFDPRVRDQDDNIVYHRDADGEMILDSTGNPIPVISVPETGVDRFMAFPGVDTKVFELSESDLDNYNKTSRMLTEKFAAVAQVPQHTLTGQMTNVSGDSRTADETSSRQFSTALQDAFGDCWAAVFELADMARGVSETTLGTQVSWTPAFPKTEMEIAQMVGQMVPNGFPPQMFMEMMPGATPNDIQRWMRMSQDAMTRALSGDLAALLAGTKPETAAIEE